ncbi:MAG: glutamyl-tRNA amidotransferase [Mesorhizobium amorphae]|nr:MAG: glutamyl-tRNA amidotransferase [Mesorhizobium amorphae]
MSTRERIAADLKAALKARDKARTSTLRLMQAAFTERDILNRGTGKEAASEEEVLAILSKMVKSREESVRAFTEGGRPELAEIENAEIEIIREYLPAAMSEAEAEEAVRAAIAKTGAASPRDMGAVMAALKAEHGGRMDFGRASGLVKQLLS